MSYLRASELKQRTGQILDAAARQPQFVLRDGGLSWQENGGQENVSAPYLSACVRGSAGKPPARSAGLQTGPVPTGKSALRRVRPRSEVEGTNGKRRAGRFLVSALS